MALSTAELARYSRHLKLSEIGVAGQERLRAAKVLVVGAGGLGSPAALYLAAAGVGTIGLVDCDRVDVSNLQRQLLFDTGVVGQPKATAAVQRLRALNPEIQITAHETELRAANALDLLGRYDLVLDGTDRLPTRYVVNDACVILKKPLVSAAIHRFEGQAFTYVPGRGPCYRCLFADAIAGAVPSCAEAGVLGVLPGVLGAIQATEAIKLITGAGEPLVGRLLTYDALEMRFNEFRVARRADCAVCGERPSITQPFDPPAACETDMPNASISRLSPTEIQTLLQQPDARQRFVLVDVREPYEFDAGHLPDSLHIPLGTLPQRLREIPADRTPVFICRVGGRSLAACSMLLSTGRPQAINLEGGLLAWAEEVDPSLDVA